MSDNRVWAPSNTGRMFHVFLSSRDARPGNLRAACRKNIQRPAVATFFTRNDIPLYTDMCVFCVDVYEAAERRAEASMQPATESHDYGYVAPVDEDQKTTGHPYDGLPQKTVGALTWACQEPRQTWFFQNAADSPRYKLSVGPGLAGFRGWYFTGNGHDQYMGSTFTQAASAAEDVILEDRVLEACIEDVKREYPKGTRVRGTDSYGKVCSGTVNGAGWGVVRDPEHPNYGMVWVDVTWDEAPHNRGTGRRNRRFVEDLIKL